MAIARFAHYLGTSGLQADAFFWRSAMQFHFTIRLMQEIISERLNIRACVAFVTEETHRDEYTRSLIDSQC